MTTRENFIEATEKAAAEHLPLQTIVMCCGETAVGDQIAIIQGRRDPYDHFLSKIVLTADARQTDDEVSIRPFDESADYTGLAPRGTTYLFEAKRYDAPVVNYPDSGALQISHALAMV